MTHADIHFFDLVLDQTDDRWCHGIADTDCLLSVLIEASFRPGAHSPTLEEAFEALSLDREQLRAELTKVRPPEVFRHPFPVQVPSATGRSVGQRVPTARLVLAGYRVREATAGASPTPVDVFHGLLGDDEGPAAEALAAVRMPPARARRLLGLADPRPAHIRPSLWPPTRQPRELAAGTATPGDPPATPPPSAKAQPVSFVFTSAGQELELSAHRHGPLVLTSRTNNEASIEICAEAAELIARFLQNYKLQLDAERWEPVYQAEQRRKPPRPTKAPDITPPGTGHD